MQHSGFLHGGFANLSPERKQGSPQRPAEHSEQNAKQTALPQMAPLELKKQAAGK